MEVGLRNNINLLKLVSDLKSNYQYLVNVFNRYGIVLKGKSFSCFRKEYHVHGDRKPSAGIYIDSNGNIAWKCQKCNVGGSLLDIIMYYEHCNFIESVLIAVEINSIDINNYFDDEAEYFRSYGIYRKLIDLINKFIISRHKTGTFARRFTDEEIDKLTKIGFYFCNINKDELFNYLSENGIKKSELFAYVNSSLLPPLSQYNSISNLFPYYFNGRPIAFVMQLDQLVHHNKAKYINSSSSVIFDKNSYFSLTQIDEKKPVYVVEGYTDALAFYLSDINNVIALTGSSIGEERIINIVSLYKFTNLRIILDNDIAGTTGMYTTAKTIMNLMHKYEITSYVDIRFFNWDKVKLEEKDPYECYRNNKFKELLDENNYIGLFSCIMKSYIDEGYELYETILKIASDIAKIKCPPLVADLIISDISKNFNIEKNIIKNQVEYFSLRVNKDSDIEMEWDSVVKSLTGPITKRIIEMESFIERIKNRIYNSVYENIDKNEFDLLLNTVRSHKYIYTGIPDTVKRIDTGEFKFALPLNESFLWVIGAKQHRGKSSLLRDIAIRLVENNDNLMIIHFSIDDSKEVTFRGYLARISGVHLSEISTTSENNDLKYAIEYFKSLYGEKIVIKDAIDAKSVNDVHMTIMKYKNMYPDKYIIAIIDNLHNLQDITIGGSKSSDGRRETEATIDTLKVLSQKEKYGLIVTSELRKINRLYDEFNAEDLKGTATIAYRADIITNIKVPYIDNYGIDFHNIMCVPYDSLVKARGEAYADEIAEILTTKLSKAESDMHIYIVNDISEIRKDGILYFPIFDLYVEKDKITGFKGSIRFIYIPERGQFFNINYKGIIISDEEYNKFRSICSKYYGTSLREEKVDNVDYRYKVGIEYQDIDEGGDDDNIFV